MAIFERTTPEACGIDSRGILAFLEELPYPGQETHHFMLLRHGKVVSEGSWAPYQPGARHVLYSVSKAFLSSAVGLLAGEGKCRLSDRLVDFFPEYRALAAPGVEEIRVEHLLTMATGQKTDARVHVVESPACEPQDRLAAFFATPATAPGTLFHYDGAASYALSRLVTRLTGQGLDDFLQSRLLEPLGIRRPYYERCPAGYCLGATGMMVSIEEMAALGQLYLQQGKWKGRQLLPASWVEQATARHIATDHVTTGPDWQMGYCYHFWRGRHNTYRFCGAYGQMCVILPELDALFLVQSAYDNNKLYTILDSFYARLLPAFHESPLPEQESARQAVQALFSAAKAPENAKPIEEWERL